MTTDAVPRRPARQIPSPSSVTLRRRERTTPRPPDHRGVSFAVCGTPRTGGNWLCGLLRRHQVGDPDEYLSPRLSRPLMAAWGSPDILAYLAELPARRAFRGVYGVKVHWNELQGFTLRDVFRVPLAEVRWVRLVRRDREAQARSWLAAGETGRWYGRSVEHRDHPADLVARRVAAIEEQEGLWREFFRVEGLSYLLVHYEDLLADRRRTIERVASWIT